jgi:hypothetical protein
MKIIKVGNDRELSPSAMSVGYLQENNVEVLKFDIPEEYKDFNKLAYFKCSSGTFTKMFDDISSNYLTLTSDITQFNELDMSIEFIDSINNIVAKTSKIHLIIEDCIATSEDISLEDPNTIVLNDLIAKVNNVNIESSDTDNGVEITITDKDGNKNTHTINNGVNGINGSNGKDGINATINGVNSLNILAGKNIELTQADSDLTINAIIPEDVSPIILDETKINELCDLSHLLSDNQVFVGYLYSKYGDGLFYVNSKFFLNYSNDTSITDEYDYIDKGSIIIVTNMGKSVIAFTKNWHHAIKYYNCINTYGGSSARYELTTLTNEELFNLIENSSNFLTKTNEEEFTPTSDYNPATKIYVDEKVKADRGIYYAEIFGTKWYAKENLQPILDLAYKGGFSDVLIRANTGGRFMTITGMNLQNLSSSTTTDITFGSLQNLIGNYLTPTTINYGYVYANKVGLDSEGNVVINGTTGMLMNSIDLMKSTALTEISGYDSSKTQTLKNVNGVLKWIDD